MSLESSNRTLMTLFGRWATINIVMVLGFPHFDEFTLRIRISKTLSIDGSKYTEHKSTSSPAPSEASATALPNPTSSTNFTRRGDEAYPRTAYTRLFSSWQCSNRTILYELSLKNGIEIRSCTLTSLSTTRKIKPINNLVAQKWTRRQRNKTGSSFPISISCCWPNKQITYWLQLRGAKGKVFSQAHKHFSFSFGAEA